MTVTSDMVFGTIAALAVFADVALNWIERRRKVTWNGWTPLVLMVVVVALLFIVTWQWPEPKP